MRLLQSGDIDIQEAVEDAWPEMTVHQLGIDSREAPAMLALQVLDTGSDMPLEARFVFDSSHFSLERMRDLVERYTTLLDAWIAPGSAAHLGDVTVLTVAEERQVLEEWPVPTLRAVIQTESMVFYEVSDRLRAAPCHSMGLAHQQRCVCRGWRDTRSCTRWRLR